MQENFNIDLLIDVLVDSIDFVEDNYTRVRLRSNLNNLVKNNEINIDDRTAIYFAYDVKMYAERYNLELITQMEYVTSLRNIILRLGTDKTIEPTEERRHKQHGA